MEEPFVFTRTYLGRIGVAADELLNVLAFNGDPAQTVSWHAATAAAEGKRWGCVCCACLGWVQRNHCQLTLDPTAVETPGAACIFGALILAALAAPIVVLHFFL